MEKNQFVNRACWRDSEIQLLLDSMLRHAGEGEGLKYLDSAFTVIRGELISGCKSAISCPEIADKYKSLGIGYLDYVQNEKIRIVNDDFSARNDAHLRFFSSYTQKGSTEEKNCSPRLILPFFRQLNLLFGKPSDLDIFNNDLKMVDTPSKHAFEDPQQKNACTGSNWASSNTLPCAEEMKECEGEGTKRPIQAERLCKTDNQLSTKVERAVATLMDEYSDILDVEEMNECLTILEDEKKATIFLGITKSEIRDLWLERQILMVKKA